MEGRRSEPHQGEARMRRTADPALTFALAVAVTSAFSSSAVAAAGRGTIDLSAAAARIVMTLAIAWCTVHAVATLVTRLFRLRRASPPSPPGAVRRLPGRAPSDRPHADVA
jgi:hypothetical protein